MTGLRGRGTTLPVVVVVTLAAGLSVSVAAPASATHGNQTSGVYRIPYADGTDVTVGNDIHNHNDAYDMSGGEGSTIVAAASGWIRGIVEHHGEEPGAGDDEDTDGDAQDDALEHACGNNDVADTVDGSCSDYNNYVWIEHPNGEWTKYTHLGTGTVSANGWTVGEWIDAGEPIGLENDIGQASSNSQADVCWSDAEDEDLPKCRAFHLHFEVAVPFDPNDLTPFCAAGGFMATSACNFGTRVPPSFCDVPGNDLIAGQSYVAAPCEHDPPTASAGGPYEVDEGSSVQLDGSATVDPDGDPVTYRWCLGFPDECPPVVGLDDRALAQPTFTGVEDGTLFVVLNAYDRIEALRSQSLTVVTVNNVPPSVTAVGDTLDEGLTALVTAAVVDPGAEDTHTVSIDWGDGSAAQPVTVAQVAAGVSHEYGDNGVFDVTVTATDDDGGVGSDTAPVVVGNLDPTVVLDGSGAISFPGGDHFVVGPGEGLAASADGTDPGSDDLTFTWNTGDVATYFNGVGPDPSSSPFGTFPFAASDQVVAAFGAPGVETLAILLTDDDGGADSAAAGVVVTGTADATQGSGWWKHQFAGTGSPQIDGDTLAGYLEVVNAVSSVFSEAVSATTFAEAHDVLSPTEGDARARVTAALMLAELQLASGAVAWDASVPLGSGDSVVLLDLLTAAEEAILDMATSSAELKDIERDLARVRHATPAS